MMSGSGPSRRCDRRMVRDFAGCLTRSHVGRVRRALSVAVACDHEFTMSMTTRAPACSASTVKECRSRTLRAYDRERWYERKSRAWARPPRECKARSSMPAACSQQLWRWPGTPSAAGRSSGQRTET